MARLIDADAFDEVLQNAQTECKKSGGNFRYGVLSNVRANLAKMPTFSGGTARPIANGDDSYICDACGETVGWEKLDVFGIDPVKYEYCPGCGRKVDWDAKAD